MYRCQLYLFALISSRVGPHVEVCIRQLILRTLTSPDRFTLDTATVFLFGSNVHSLDAPLHYAHNSPKRETMAKPHSSDKFAKAFGQAQNQISLRNRLGAIWPFLEFRNDKTTDAMREIHNFIDPILKDALEKRQREGKRDTKDDNSSETLLDHLVEETAGEQTTSTARYLTNNSYQLR